MSENALMKRIAAHLLEDAIEQVAVTADLKKDAIARRDSIIRFCNNIGMSRDELVELTNLGKSTIYAILASSTGRDWLDLEGALVEISEADRDRDERLRILQKQVDDMQALLSGGALPRRRPRRPGLAAVPVREERADEPATGTEE